VYEELSTKSDLEVQQYIIVNDTKVNSLLVTNVPVCDVLKDSFFFLRIYPLKQALAQEKDYILCEDAKNHRTVELSSPRFS
jgi:hypothetical protein